MPRFSTAVEAVTQELRDDIVKGRLAPGQRLMVNELATKFEVSPIPIREALGRLAAQGLVAIHPYRGMRVAELSSEEIREIFFIRELLEGEAAKLGARNMRSETRSRLNELMEEMRESARVPKRWITIDREFHMTVYEASGHNRLVHFIGQLRDDIERYARLYITLQHNIPQSMRRHQEIRSACLAADGSRARSATVSHLRETAAMFIEEIERNPTRTATPRTEMYGAATVASKTLASARRP